jgi:hypothetical protein
MHFLCFWTFLYSDLRAVCGGQENIPQLTLQFIAIDEARPQLDSDNAVPLTFLENISKVQD